MSLKVYKRQDVQNNLCSIRVPNSSDLYFHRKTILRWSRLKISLYYSIITHSKVRHRFVWVTTLKLKPNNFCILLLVGRFGESHFHGFSIHSPRGRRHYGYGFRKLARRGYTWGPPGPRVRALNAARGRGGRLGGSIYSYGLAYPFPILVLGWKRRANGNPRHLCLSISYHALTLCMHTSLFFQYTQS